MDTSSKYAPPKTRVIDLAKYSNEFPPGTKIDRYEIVSTLGSGGCGVVYSARHVHLDQIVALKLLHRALIHSEERVTRFFREARAAAAVGNPHIVRVSDCGISPEGIPFLAMEFLRGVVLEELVGEGHSVPLERAINIELQILDGLEAAHEAGVVHRDLKPENIFLVPEGEGDFVKLVDFGVSKVFKDSEHYQKALTGTGALLGTPRYMAPEQFRGARGVDHRADLFAAAVVLYQMLSGQLPFDGRTPLELAHRASTQPPRPLTELVADVSSELVEVVERGLAKEPDERWINARAFATALTSVTQVGSRRRRSPSATIPVGVGGLLAGVVDDEEPTYRTSVDEAVFDTQRDGRSATTLDGRNTIPTAFSADDDVSTDPIADTHPSSVPAAVEQISIPPAFALYPPEHVEQSSQLPDQTSRPPEPVAERNALADTTEDHGPGAFPAASSVEQSSQPPAPSSPPTPPPAGAEEEGAERSYLYIKLFLLLGVIVILAGLVVGFIAFGPSLHYRESAPPMTDDGQSGVVFDAPLITGQVEESAIGALLENARAHVEMCRQPGVEQQVTLEAHIAPPGFSTSRLSLVRASADNSGSDVVTSCCIDALRAGASEDWNPGQSGVFTISMRLPPR